MEIGEVSEGLARVIVNNEIYDVNIENYAELTSGAHAVVYTAQRVIKEAKAIRLGLPSRCSTKVNPSKIVLESLLPAEEDVEGHAEDKDQALEKVSITEMPNPRARGFRLLEIAPKG